MTHPQQYSTDLFVGLMSGTSADGIDAALVRFSEHAGQLQCALLHGRTYGWDDETRQALIALGQAAHEPNMDELARLDVRVGQRFASAAQLLLQEAEQDPAEITAIGSHGQTIRHRPSGEFPFTWQIGDAHVIAERTGIATVADFRRRDVAAGGHGAPLMPAFHAAMWHSAAEDRAVLNLGGIGNFTLLPQQGPVRGFDTGPANALLDAWCARHTAHAFDAGGAFAASGQVDTALLQALLADPWFALPPPKSTGREQFHLAWLQAALQPHHTAADVQATLLELSATTVAQALHGHQPHTRRVLVCGGGVHNPVLMARIAAHLPDAVVESTQAFGLDPDFVEAMGFAWLARETLAGRPGNLPSVSGARGPRVLGVIHPA